MFVFYESFQRSIYSTPNYINTIIKYLRNQHSDIKINNYVYTRY